jgi:acyl dehydratase
MITFSSQRDVASHVGQHLGYSDYVDISQERVNQFAEATGDHQWIHVDVERAADGPFGGTIAHGYLTLALGPVLLHDVIEWKNTRMGVNYGLDKVRFPAPVPVGSRVRLGAELRAADAIGDDGVQVMLVTTFEIEGATKPACVAELLLRYFFT